MIQFYNYRLKIFVIFMLVSYAFTFTGCRTGPDFAVQNYPGVIADDGKLLVHFNLSRDSIILNKFISRYSAEDLSSVIDRTERLSLAIDSLGPDTKFTILAEGNYPKTFANLAIGREENWIKHKDNYIWWENRVEKSYVSVPTRSVALISNNDIHTGLSYIESGNRNFIPEYVKTEFDQAAVIIYSHSPAPKLYESLNIPDERMSVQELFFIIRKDCDDYSISGVLEFLDESDAKIFSTVLKLGLLLKLRETGKTSVMKIVHDGHIEAVKNSIIIDNILLNPEEIIELTAGSSSCLQGN